MSQPIRYSRRSLGFVGSLVALVPAGIAVTRAVGAEEATVTIDNFRFTPAQITVPVGAKVTWINNDGVRHLVVVATNPRAIKSWPLGTGERYGFTYATAGIYPYFCGLHPQMTGTVVVKS